MTTSPHHVLHDAKAQWMFTCMNQIMARPPLILVLNTDLRMFVIEIIHLAFQFIEQNIIRFNEDGTDLPGKVCILSDELQGQYWRTIKCLTGPSLYIRTRPSEPVNVNKI